MSDGPFFDKAWQRDQYHRKLDQIEKDKFKVLRAMEMQKRAEREAAERIASINAAIDREGDYIEPLNYTPAERRALRELYGSTGYSGRRNNTYLRA